MPRADRFALAFLIVLSGCTTVRPVVFVDVDAVARSHAPQPFQTPKTPQPPDGIPAKTTTLPGKPAKTLRLEDTAQRLQHIRETLRAAQEATIADLTQRLRTAYYRELRQLEAERLALLEPDRRAGMEAAFAAFREVFERYADKRGPLVARLALLAGFPDPDPTSTGEPGNAHPYAKKRYQEATELRKKISDLEAVYEQEIRGLLEGPQRAYADALTALRIEIEEKRAEADRRAMEEAKRQVQLEEEGIRTSLQGRTSVELPAEPGRSITLPGTKQPRPAPAIEAMTAEELLAWERDAVANDLDIWLAQNGYVRATQRGAGRNATEEFKIWREKLRVGP